VIRPYDARSGNKKYRADTDHSWKNAKRGNDAGVGRGRIDFFIVPRPTSIDLLLKFGGN
jgi:hypothetical protein